MMKTAHEAAIEGLRHLLSDQACAEVGHVSGLGLGRLPNEHILGNAPALPDKSSNDAVNKAVGKHVGPLVDRLIGDIDRDGCGSGAAEQFNSVGLAHATLNHSLSFSATLVHRTRVLWGMADDDEYSTRLKRALKDHGNLHPQVLADHLGVSLQGVRKVLEGKSAAFNVFNHFEACRFLGIDAEWLATGDKQMTPADEGQTEAERLAAALESLTSALQKADKNTRIAIEPLLASMANEPREARNKSRVILRLLVTKDEGPVTAETGPGTSKKIGVLIGGSATQDLGGTHGRRNRDATARAAKK